MNGFACHIYCKMEEMVTLFLPFFFFMCDFFTCHRIDPFLRYAYEKSAIRA